MKRAAAVALLLPIAIAGPLQVALQAQACDECMPRRYNYANLSGTYYVCISGGDPNVNPSESFNPDEYEAIKDGVQEYWNDRLWSHGANVSFQFRSYNNCEAGDITVTRDPSITDDRSRADLTTDGHGAGMRVPPNWVKPVEEWKFASAHEFGHLLDYRDAFEGEGQLPSHCQDKTILGGSWQ